MRVVALLVGGALLAASLPAEARRGPRCGDGLTQRDHLVFARGPNGTADIWSMRGDRSQARRLSATGQDSEPALSPDGKHVVFVSRRDGNAELYLVNADGSGLRRLTRSPFVREGRPTWHPDGRRVAFHSGPRDNTSTELQDLEVLDVVSGARRHLTSTPGTKEVKPAWSPDGRYLAFEAGGAAVANVVPNDDIWVVRLADGRRTRLTDGPGREWFPAWSPDGRQIAFVSGRDGNFEVYVMRADGTGQRRVTNSVTYDTTPTWSPDGSRVVFTEDDALAAPAPVVFAGAGSTRAWLVSVRPDGSGRTQLTSGAEDYEPSYQPCRA